jgi:hypothetical protein
MHACVPFVPFVPQRLARGGGGIPVVPGAAWPQQPTTRLGLCPNRQTPLTASSLPCIGRYDTPKVAAVCGNEPPPESIVEIYSFQPKMMARFTVNQRDDFQLGVPVRLGF